MQPTHRYAGAALAAGTLFLSSPSLADVGIADIGTINGLGASGTAINHVGDVSGVYTFSGSVGDPNGTPSERFLNHAVLAKDGAARDLGAIEVSPTCSSLGCESAALGINDQDWVVGWSDTKSSGTLAFLWLPEPVSGGNAGFNVLPALSPTSGSIALAINSAGQVVGFSKLADFSTRAIRWRLEPGGATLTDLGTLRSDDTGTAIADGINDLGQIVGSASDENRAPQGFLWLPEPAYGLSAGMHDLTGSLNQFSAEAVCLNNRGEVAGVVDTTQPFVWLPAPAYGLPAGLSLLTFDRDILGFIPVGITDAGAIVGRAFVQTNEGTRDFVIKPAAWRNGKWIMLDDLLPKTSPWELVSANGVTRSGKTTLITGLGQRSDVTFNGVSPVARGYVLSVSCSGDLNDDGGVNQNDLSIVRSQLGQTVLPGTGGDLNGDGVVNQQDVVLLSAQLGAICL